MMQKQHSGNSNLIAKATPKYLSCMLYT